MDLLSFPSALLAVTVEVKALRLDTLPEISPELLMLRPLLNHLLTNWWGYGPQNLQANWLAGGYKTSGHEV